VVRLVASALAAAALAAFAAPAAWANAVSEFALHPDSARPWAITAGPDGGLWFTHPSQNEIGRITTSGPLTPDRTRMRLGPFTGLPCAPMAL